MKIFFKNRSVFAFSFLVVFSILLLVPALASAAQARFPYWGPLVSCTGPLTNPDGTTNANACKSVCDLFATGQNIIYFMMTIAVFAVAPIMIVIGGIMILISAGSQERISSGRKMVTGAVIGIAIALGAFIIVNTFFYVISIATGGSSRDWFKIECFAPSNPSTIAPNNPIPFSEQQFVP